VTFTPHCAIHAAVVIYTLIMKTEAKRQCSLQIAWRHEAETMELGGVCSTTLLLGIFQASRAQNLFYVVFRCSIFNLC